jgi:hypothetical protein
MEFSKEPSKELAKEPTKALMLIEEQELLREVRYIFP